MSSYLWYIFQNLNHIINCSITYWFPACAFLKVAQQLWSASKHKLNTNSLGSGIRGAVSVKNQWLISSLPLWNPKHILLQWVISLKLVALLTAAKASILLFIEMAHISQMYYIHLNWKCPSCICVIAYANAPVLCSHGLKGEQEKAFGITTFKGWCCEWNLGKSRLLVKRRKKSSGQISSAISKYY